MNCLVTAGNTQVLIDKVRCITNIFSGRTGAQIALELQKQGHSVTLLTSRPEAIAELHGGDMPCLMNFRTFSYQTFEELHALMAEQIQSVQFDAIIHSAAVSDYLTAGVFAPSPSTSFDASTLSFTGSPVAMKDVAAGKVKSSHEELWLRFVKAPKLVDKIRTEWGFAGCLVKFKLEVGITEQQLETIAEASRVQSHADLMVANTFEGMRDWAILGPIEGKYQHIPRPELARRVVEAVTKQVK
jgi:phosphopantothenoylcysteine synthetase/decarboxylase